MKNTVSMAAIIAATGLALPAITQTAIAQQTADLAIEEIFVTASKRGAVSVQDIPYNISAVTGDTIQRAGITDLSDFARIVPGLSMIDNGPSNKQIVIRGLAASAGTEQVSIYFDEVPASGIGGTNVQQTDLQLYDVDRIEVLRGPQGTLYGAGSQAGTIRYIMSKPDSTEFGASIDGSLGFRSRNGGENWSVNGMVNAPVVEDIFAIRVVGYYRNTDGFLNRPDRGEQGTDKRETFGGRFLADLNLGENTTLSAAIYYQDTHVDDNPRGLAGSDDKPGPVYEPFDDEIEMYNLTLEHDLDWGTVTATGSLFKRYTFFSFDQSQFTPGMPNRINQPANTETYSGEVRFASNFDGPVQMIAGAFYQERDFTADSFLGFVDETTGGLNDMDPAFFNVQDASFSNKAVFGELTYDVTDRFSLIAGARVFELKRTALNTLLADVFGRPLGPGPLLESKFSDVVWRFQASYDLSDDVLVYATYSEGFREGGENSPALTGNIPPSFAPDVVENMEIGIKSELFDRQLTLNSAVYYMKWNDIQVSTFDDTGAFTYISNAGKADLYGIEIEGTARPNTLPGFTANFSFRYSQQKLTEDNPAANPPGAPANPSAGLDGDRIPESFPIQASLGLEQRFPLGNFDGYVRGDVSYTGKARTQFNTFSPQYREWGDFFLTNLRAGIEDENWGAAIYASNVFNVRQPVNWNVQTVPGIPDLVQTTQPREIGVRASYRF
ncbi:MAG: TonB-dependent receptor [Sphingomonadales bacterium]